MTPLDHSKCQTLLGSLSEYVDGTLSEELCEEIDRHIAECQNCHIVVDTLRKTISLYHESAAETGVVPAVVRERLFRTLNLDDYLQH
ncbi:MAG TPA: zf-HC2 domain-containing protein [Anaerolineales bacterium]